MEVDHCLSCQLLTSNRKLATAICQKFCGLPLWTRCSNDRLHFQIKQLSRKGIGVWVKNAPAEGWRPTGWSKFMYAPKKWLRD